MSAVPMKKDETQVVPADANSIMAVIARAASDPNTNVEKMEKLLEMYERMEARNAKAAYAAAFLAMKPELPVIDRRGRIVIHEKGKDKIDENIIQETPFARWEDIDEAITPILTQHGFVLTFRSGVAVDGKVTVTGILMHEGGHSEETTMALPHDSSGSKNPVQAVGSSTSYGRRYTATLLLNIRTHGEDDDGTKAGSPETLTDDEVAQVFDRLKLTKGDTDKFCKFMKVGSVPDILRKNFGNALEAIESAAAARIKRASNG